MMDSKTLERLLNAGWYTDRKIDISLILKKYEEIKLGIPINVKEFLYEFGILKVDASDKKYYDVDFDPLKVIGVNFDGDYFRECLVEYGINETGYPIGMACRNNLMILMTEKSKFYCFTDGCLIKAGNSVEEMLDCLVGECRDAEEIE